MIKKTFHLLFALLFCAVLAVALGLAYYWLFLTVYDTNILAPRTYKMIADYWNRGGIIKGGDALMLLCLFSYLPLFLFGCWKIFHFKFIKLLTVPLNWLCNRGLSKYAGGMPSVNIKNLKVEEKKTIEQVVQERLEAENKKHEEQQQSEDVRKRVIDEIETKLK